MATRRPAQVGTRPASGSTTAGRSGTSTTMDAHKERCWAKPSVATACALTELCPHPSACMDTAYLMAVGRVESSRTLVPDMNGLPPDRLRELREIVSTWRGPGTLVLVTHGLTIQALIRSSPAQAETVVLRPTPGVEPGAVVVDRIAPPF